MTDRPKAFAAVTCTTILWGVSFIGTKMALETLTVFSYVFSRFLLASIIFIFLLKRKGIPRLDRSLVIRMVVLALLQPFGYFFFESLGLKYTAATKASLLIALIPLLSPGHPGLFLRKGSAKRPWRESSCRSAGCFSWWSADRKALNPWGEPSRVISLFSGPSFPGLFTWF